MTKPFRHNVTRRSELGRLIDGPAPDPYPRFFEDLRECAANVLAFSRDCDLVFVGRSPENIYDYLNGALKETSFRERLGMLNLSLRGFERGASANTLPKNFNIVREHLRELKMDPKTLLVRERPIVLVDLVATGFTFRGIQQMLVDWAKRERLDVPALRRKLRFLAITWRKKTSPNIWRWREHARWLQNYPPNAARSTSAPWQLWGLLGNTQNKTVLTNPPARWGDQALQSPSREEANIEALRFAARVYERGQEDAERKALTRLIAAHPNMRERWLRTLVSELRGNIAR